MRPAPLKLSSWVKQARERLICQYEEREAGTIADRLVEHFLGYGRTKRLMKGSEIMPGASFEKLEEALKELEEGKPLQYILGEVPFHQVTLKVDERGLIPRQETEELVELVLTKESGRKARVMDIGTGSGCMAVALARGWGGAEVHATDVDEEALELARDNARRNDVKVQFHQHDVLLQEPSEIPTFDVVVSNPPYVLEKERSGMESRVVDHEPSQALFVPDDDPLLFYKAILMWNREHLKEDGRVYFEVHEEKAGAIVALLEKSAYRSIECHRDLQEKERMVSAVKPA